MRRFPWLVVLGVVGWWGLNAVIVTSHLLAFRSARGDPMTLQEILPAQLVSAAIWVLCTLWLLWWTARTPLERERWLAPLGSLLLAVLAVAVFRTSAVLVLEPWVDWYNTPPRSGALLFNSILRNATTGLLIVGAGHALVYAQRARARERQAQVLQEQLTQARLDALSAQLNPHFLFNTLNSIAEMVHHDAQAADRMLVQLGGCCATAWNPVASNTPPCTTSWVRSTATSASSRRAWATGSSSAATSSGTCCSRGCRD
jgi:hypothetical protein